MIDNYSTMILQISTMFSWFARICVLIFAAFPVVWSDNPIKLCTSKNDAKWCNMWWILRSEVSIFPDLPDLSSSAHAIAIPTSSCPAASGGADPLLGRRVDLRPLNVWSLMELDGDGDWMEIGGDSEIFWRSWAVQLAPSSWDICRFPQLPSNASSWFGNDRELA